jgi:hypothetical protein
VELRFVEENPSTRATFASIERSAQIDAQARRRPGMRQRRSRIGVELAVDELGDQMRWNGEQIVVVCVALGRIRHG